jgi:hypothetical protein
VLYLGWRRDGKEILEWIVKYMKGQYMISNNKLSSAASYDIIEEISIVTRELRTVSPRICYQKKD